MALFLCLSTEEYPLTCIGGHTKQGGHNSLVQAPHPTFLGGHGMQGVLDTSVHLIARHLEGESSPDHVQGIGEHHSSQTCNHRQHINQTAQGRLEERETKRQREREWEVNTTAVRPTTTGNMREPLWVYSEGGRRRRERGERWEVNTTGVKQPTTGNM